MKMPITKRTALSLAITASLACGFSSAFSASTDYYCASFNCTVENQKIESNLFLYSTDGYDKKSPPSTSDNLSLTLTGATVTPGQLYTGSVYGIYSNGGKIEAGSVTLNITNSSVTSTGDESLPYGIFGVFNSGDGLAVGDISITVNNGSSNAINASIYGLYDFYESGSTTSGNISVAVTNTTVSGGVYAYYGEIADKTTIEDVTVTLDGSTVSSTTDSIHVAGIYNTDSSSSLSAGDVTVSITNGSSVDTPNVKNSSDYDVAGEAVYGVYSDAGSMTTGDVSITISGDCTNVTGHVYGALIGGTSDTVDSVTINLTDSATLTNGNLYGAYVIGDKNTIKVGDVKINITDSTTYATKRRTGTSSTGSATYTAYGTAYGLYVSQADKGSTIKVGDITITARNSSVVRTDDDYGGNVYGFYASSSAEGTINIGDITIEIDDYAYDGSTIGYSSGSGGTNDSLVVNIDSLTLIVHSDLDEASSGNAKDYVRGTQKSDPGTLNIAGDVLVAVIEMSEGRVQGLTISGGTTKIGGDLTLYLKDIHNAAATYDNVTGLWVEGDYTDARTKVTVDGSVNVIYDATASNVATSFHQDIFGVGIGGYGAMPNGSDVTVGGDVAVYLGGDAENLGLGTHSVYGVLVGLDQDSSYETGKNTFKFSGSGSRILYFGYEENPFKSHEGDSFKGSFSNFDEIVVTDGSVLYLGSDQNAHLIGDQDFFGFSTTYEVWPSGERVVEDIDYGPVESFANINGLWSRGGVLYLAEESGDIPASKLTLEAGATANIMVVHNNGAIEIGDGATLTTYSCQTLLETSSATTPAESVVDHEINTALYKDVAYESMNAGTITGTGTLVLESASSLTESETSKPSAYAFVNTGTIEISNFVLGDDAALDVQAGSVKVDTKADLSKAGYLEVGEKAVAELNVTDDVNALIWVHGKLAITSEPDDFEWADSAISSADASATSNILAVRTAVTTGDTGSISVGGDGHVINSGETTNPDTSAGVYFDSDSTLVVDSSILTVNSSDAAITGSGTAEVVAGAKVILYGSMSKGKYTILSGYDTDGVEGWYKPDEDTSSDQVYVVDTSGLSWSYYRGANGDTVFIELTEHEDISNVYPDLSIPNIANDQLNDCSSGGLVCSVLNDSSLSSDEKTKLLNSTAALSFAGGVMATSMTDVTAAIDSLHNHLTMDSDTFGKDGNLWPWDKSSNLWIDVLGSWQHSKHLDATGISNYKYRANSYGFILGYDYKLPSAPMVVGGAFSFSDGDLKSHGGVSKTKNKYQTYGVHLFSNYSPSSYYNIIGSLHWFHNSADIKQYASTGTAKAKVQTNLLAVGLRGETTIKAGQVNFVPHAEARYIYGKSGKYTTKLDGANLWKTKAEGTHTVQFPVGVAARADVKTESGWNLRPLADVYVIPQVGNTKQKTTVRTTDGVSDTIDGQFMGKFGAGVKVGMQADKGNATVGLKYGFLGGTKGRADHSVILQGRYRF